MTESLNERAPHFNGELSFVVRFFLKLGPGPGPVSWWDYQELDKYF